MSSGIEVPKELAAAPHRIDSALGRFNAGFDPDLQAYHSAPADFDPRAVWDEIKDQLPELEDIDGKRRLRFNWPEGGTGKEALKDTPVNVIKFPFLNDAETNKHLGWQSYRIAELTGLPTIVLETSRPKDKSISPFESDATADATTLKNFGVRHINIASNSMGSTSGIKLAARASQFGLNVLNVHVSGEPTVENRGLVKLARDLLEQDHAYKAAQRFPFDADLWAASEQSSDSTPGAQWAYLKRIGLGSVAKYVWAMRKDSFMNDAWTALATQPDMKLVVVETGHDTVAKQTRVRAMRQALLARNPGLAPRIKTRIFPDGDHGTADATFWPENVALAFRTTRT